MPSCRPPKSEGLKLALIFCHSQAGIECHHRLLTARRIASDLTDFLNQQDRDYCIGANKNYFYTKLRRQRFVDQIIVFSSSFSLRK
jgi:hypothetical protein